MGHADQYPYPVYQQASPSLGEALQIVTGQAGDMDRNCKLKTLHTVASFAMGQVFPHEHEPQVFASPELDGLMAWANEGQPVEMRGINWKGLISKLLPLILTLLAEAP